MHNYKLIIFDFDGTLCATHEAIFFCLRKTYETLGKAFPTINFRAAAAFREGIEMQKIFKLLSPEASDRQIQALMHTYKTIYLDQGNTKSTVFPKVDEVLKKLFNAGYILAVVSNKVFEAVNQELDQFALTAYFSIVIGDSETLRKKPHPMAYKNFIQVQFPLVALREVLVVGDTSVDMLFARNIGADACWAKYGYGNAKHCHALKPTYSINHVTELLAILL